MLRLEAGGQVPRFLVQARGGTHMRTFTKIAATLGVVGTIALGSVVPAGAFWIGHRHHHYYNYGGGTWNGSPPHRTVQGGVRQPYRPGPGDSRDAGNTTVGWRPRVSTLTLLAPRP